MGLGVLAATILGAVSKAVDSKRRAGGVPERHPGFDASDATDRDPGYQTRSLR
jgi:hypothetical protein